MATIKPMDLGLRQAYDELFMNDAGRAENRAPRVQELPLQEIDGFEGHPFQVRQDESMDDLMQSIRESGVLVPAIVRMKPDGRYELISGHRRKAACEALGMTVMPCIVREMSRDEAVITMVDSNIQRERILPSEKAFAYKMKLEAIRHQGTSGQRGQKWAREEIADSESGRTVQRFIRLTNLIPELLERVDSGSMAMTPAVELSYLDPDEQRYVLEAMEYQECTPSLAQARRLKALSQAYEFTKDSAFDILVEDKPNQREKPVLPLESVRRYFSPGTSSEQMIDTICKLLEGWQRDRRMKQKDRGDAR